MAFSGARHLLSEYPVPIAAGLVGVAIVAAVLATMPAGKPPSQMAHLPRRTFAHATAHAKIAPVGRPVAPKAPPKGPSVFAQESAMTPRELLARWEPLIATASKRFKVPAAWIRAVMRMESGGRTMLAEGKPITSSAGAMGIMQVMPQTYALMRARYGLGADPYDPNDNVLAGTATLAILYKSHGYPMMFAAYNDGAEMLAAHDRAGQPWPAETVNYVAGITAILSGGVPGRAGGATVRLTRPDGAAVMIDAAAVMSVRAALPGEYAPGVQTVIAVQRMRQGVRESLAQVRAVIRSHGGRV
jgi:soluble lytic murein transglycosylase-like protein